MPLKHDECAKCSTQYECLNSAGESSLKHYTSLFLMSHSY